MAAPPPPPGQQHVEHQREPCPDRILDDIGGAFAMGAVGGGAWHMVKGLKNSPPGYRIRGSLESMRREAPRLGGSFANWGLTFSLFDCSLQYLRKKEDPWNAIGAGTLTGGFLQLRFGLKSAAKSAVFGGVLLAMIEGLGIALNKMVSPPPPGAPYQPPMPGPVPPGAPVGPELVVGGPELAAAGPGMGPSTSGSAMDGSSIGSGAGGSGSSSTSSWWSFFGGGEEAKPAASSSTPQTFTEDAFSPPPLPKEFTGDFKEFK